MKRCKWTLAAVPVLLFASAHAASPNVARVEVTRAVHQDVLPALRDVAPDPNGYKQMHEREERMIPLPYVPPNQTDGALQDYRGPGGLLAPTFQSGVDGVGKGFSGPQGTFTVQYGAATRTHVQVRTARQRRIRSPTARCMRHSRRSAASGSSRSCTGSRASPTTFPGCSAVSRRSRTRC